MRQLNPLLTLVMRKVFRVSRRCSRESNIAELDDGDEDDGDDDCYWIVSQLMFSLCSH